MDYDLIVIGGTAGMNAIKTAHALGAKVAVVEEESFAGTCLMRRLNSQKVLVSTIELLTRARRSKELGITGAENLRRRLARGDRAQR